MKKILILVLGIFVFASQSYAGGSKAHSPNAWWLDIEFKPTKRVLNGVPLERFNKDWMYGEILSSIDLSQKISPEEVKEFNSSRFSFEKRVDINRNGKQERIVVGVYQRHNGEQGRFVAIFESNKLLKTISEDGTAGFSALLVDKGQIYWYFCMQCGESHKLIWNNNDYFIDF